MIDEVFEARMALAFMRGSRRRKQFVFGFGVLEDGFDDHVGARHAVAGDVGRHARHELGRLAGVLEALCEGLARAHQRRLDEFQFAILQRHVEAALRAPGGDVATHHARADHVYALERQLALAAQVLEPLLQREHAHQVARGLSDHELGDGARFGLVRALRRARRASSTGR